MKFTRTKLEELKTKNLSRMCIDELDVTIPEAATPEERAEGERMKAELDTYLKAFLKPDPQGKCVCCGQVQGAKDPIHGLLTGAAFVWGIQHGEGHCAKCGYPGRARHYVGDWFKWGAILQYHPEELSFKV